ncbi:MAG: tetratricopeptide repeat protein [Pseudanabaena sp. RU_4_16]|nr:tetratricopeptide repeat protein [Pseudanabaena sp. RU_4_16]
MISIQPDSPYAWVGKGNALLGLRQYDEALKAYDRATQIKPDYFLGWTGRGAVFNNLRKYDEALAAYEQATKVKPDSALAWAGHGEALRFKLKYQEAIVPMIRRSQLARNIVMLGLARDLPLTASVSVKTQLLPRRVQLKSIPILPMPGGHGALCSMKADAMKVHWRPQRKPSALMTSISMPGS